MKYEYLTFEAYSKKNVEQKTTSQFNLMIDYLDIVQVSIIKIPNEDAAMHTEQFVRSNYRFTYLLQVEVSTINGLSAVEQSLD